MSTKKIERAIIKYLTQEADSDDLDVLSEWIQKTENQKQFENYVKIHYKVTLAMHNPDVIEIKNNLLLHIKRDREKVRIMKMHRSIFKYAAAAVLVGILTTVYFYRVNLFNLSIEESMVPTVVDVKSIDPGTDKATLTLEDGSNITLEKGIAIQTVNANSNGEQIIYEDSKENVKKLEYNYLTIPRGGQYQLTLADGTRVWLNSETQLKYPVRFIENQTREVELVYGEAYFDVSPSTNNKGTKFKVFNKSQEVEVLGTEFNIKAYKDDANIYTTLVEGKVVVGYDGKSQHLTPNQKSSFNMNTGTLVVASVDVFNEVSWKDGIFSFEEESLQNIMKVLSRWYDVEVTFENEAIKDEEFIGLLRKDQSLNKIISTIKDFGIIKNYQFNGKQLILR